jgi:RimJ/RimL family protein N-acetyltransferase
MNISFRRLAADDLRRVHEWLHREHVGRWWRPADRYEDTAAHYLPAIEGREPTDLYLVVVDGRPVGMIQTYLYVDYPESEALVQVGPNVAGVDLFIGEEELTGRGLGSDVLRRFTDDVVFARPGTTACAAGVEIANEASQRAFAKAGFHVVRDYEEEGRPHRLFRRDRVAGPQTWHYGLVAEWWANFNTDGPEIEYFERFVRSGPPALDAGCGTGRLLVPWLRAGLDVDGCDVSADMVALCREHAEREGLAPTLFVQPLHELDPPRRYRTIVVCGVFGIGTTRREDEQGLHRLHDALEPGGTLLLDKEVPWAMPARWRRWASDERAKLPAPWPEQGTHRTAADGAEYILRTRTLAVDPLDQLVTMELGVEKRRGEELLATEERRLTERMYFRDELVLLLERAGFESVDVRAGYSDAEPTPDDDFLVFVAS